MFTAFQQKLFGAALAVPLDFRDRRVRRAVVRASFGFSVEIRSGRSSVAAALILSFILSPLVDFVSRRAHVSASAAVRNCLRCGGGVRGGSCGVRASAGGFRNRGNLRRASRSCRTRGAQHRRTLPRFARNPARIRRRNETRGGGACVVCAAAAAAKKVFETAVAATGGLVSFFSFLAAFAVVPIYLYYMLTSNFDFYSKL